LKVKKLSEELAELKKISKILALVNAQTLENELSKYATTEERKKAWILIDGNRQPDEIAENAGLKLRATNIFLKSLTDATLIENPRGEPPRKILDYVPASWLNLIRYEESKNKETGEINEPNK
jgi:hypothetical protein